MKLPRREFLRLAAGAAALPVAGRVAWAQAYPTRPVRIIVPVAPGGALDIIARIVGQQLSGRLGQPFVIENRPGAGTNIGIEAAVRAPADGYTLLLIPQSVTTNATLYESLSFNFIRDIVPVAMLSSLPLVMEVSPQLPAKTVAEFIAYAKSNPGKVTMASGGTGSASHVGGELFKLMTGIDMLHVPYRGGSPALTDLIGGQVTNCKISLCHSDLALPISRRANTGAMRFAKCAPDPPVEDWAGTPTLPHQRGRLCGSSFSSDCGSRGDQDGRASGSIGPLFFAASALCLARCSCSDSGLAFLVRRRFVPGVGSRSSRCSSRFNASSSARRASGSTGRSAT
jgi:hypothetical protein